MVAFEPPCAAVHTSSSCTIAALRPLRYAGVRRGATSDTAHRAVCAAVPLLHHGGSASAHDESGGGARANAAVRVSVQEAWSHPAAFENEHAGIHSNASERSALVARCGYEAAGHAGRVF